MKVWFVVGLVGLHAGYVACTVRNCLHFVYKTTDACVECTDASNSIGCRALWHFSRTLIRCMRKNTLT
jgi:hypothetical protein